MIGLTRCNGFLSIWSVKAMLTRVYLGIIIFLAIIMVVSTIIGCCITTNENFPLLESDDVSDIEKQSVDYQV